MKCSNCDRENTADARYCSNCGADLSYAEQNGSHQGERSDATMAVPVVVSPQPENDMADIPESVAPGTAVLIVRRGPEVGTRYELEKPVTTAGRSADADILLDDVTVSRRHVEFLRDEGVVRVQDLGSLNGTYVNQESVLEAELRSGDEVQIGKFKLLYLGNLR